MTRFELFFRTLRRRLFATLSAARHALPGSRRGATAVEFAILLPPFLLFIFGILEIGLIMLYENSVSSGARAGVDYLRNATINQTTITQAGLRKAVSTGFFISPSDSKLKIALRAIYDADLTTVPITYPIDNYFEVSADNAGQYVLEIGYNWSFILPMTSKLLAYQGNVPQLQTITLAVTAVRVKE